MDASIVQQIWNGSVPVCFVFDQLVLPTTAVNAVVVTTPPPPALPLMCPRLAYLHTLRSVLLDHIQSHLTTQLPTQPIELLFTCHRLQLDLHLSIGVLYDVLTTANDKQSNGDSVFTINVTLDCNAAQSPTQTPDLSHTLTSNLKQAIYTRYTACNYNTALTAAEQQLLYQSLTDVNYNDFAHVFRKLELVHGEDVSHDKQWAACPVRLLIVDDRQLAHTEQHTAMTASITADVFTPIQRPINEVSAAGDGVASTTLFDALQTFIPIIHQHSDGDDNTQLTIVTSDRTGGDAVRRLCSVTIQGLSGIPLSTSIKWLCQHLSSADQWLYVVLHCH